METKERRTRMRDRLVGAGVAFLIGSLAGPAVAAHWGKDGWRDEHINYPPVPHGYSAIVDVFGKPCNQNARKISMSWPASDNGVLYTFKFHRKLGGKGTAWLKDKGGASTNLDNDVRGHIGNQHLGEYVRHGIWGYNCRYIAGTTKWSTHAWGIAVDVSSAWEPAGQCYSKVNYHHDQIWKDHGWKWGKQWCDAMHFQYARNY